MKRHNSLAAVVGAIALLAPSAAQAQQTADVDALASLEVAETSLTVRGVRDMQFGVVTIPDNSRAVSNVVCSYDLSIGTGISGGDPFVTTGRTIRESPDFDNLGSPSRTMSGCEFRAGSPSLSAAFEIACAPNIATNYQITWTDSTADPAINFVPVPFNVALPLVSGTIEVLPDAPSASATSGSVSCPAGGAIDLLVGGTLQVGRTAVVASDISVGSVSLAVNY